MADATPPGGAMHPNDASNPWHRGNRFELTVSDPQAICTWEIELGPDSDAHLTIAERSPAGERSGEIIVVGGRVMLWRDLKLEPGCESDALDGASMMLQLALHLLWRTVPPGADAVTGQIAIGLSEPDEDLVVGTLGAGGAFPAPWRVHGSTRPMPGGAVRFDLSFSFGQGELAGRLDLGGSWEHQTPQPALDEQMSLAGWSLRRLGVRLEDNELDYGATALTSDATTIAALRQQIAALG